MYSDLRMITVRKVVLVAGDTDHHWNESARTIGAVLDAARKRLAVRLKIDRERAISDPADPSRCVVVHASASPAIAIRDAVEQKKAGCFVVVTGAGDALGGEYSWLRDDARVFGVPMVYGREANFAAWIEAWARKGFTLDSFRYAAGELVAPSTDLPPAAARRLNDAVAPLHTLLSGYLWARSREDADAPRLEAWMRESLRSWRIECTFSAGDLRRLLAGIRGTGEGAGERARLREALTDLPRRVEELVSGEPDAGPLTALFQELDDACQLLGEIANETPAAAAWRTTPLDEIRELQAAIRGAHHVEIHDSVMEAVKMIARSTLYSWDDGKRFAYLLEALASGRELTAADRRLLAADLGLLSWLAETEALDRRLATVSHELHNKIQALNTRCEIRRRRPEQPMNLAGIGRLWLDVIDWMRAFVRDLGPELGIVPSSQFDRSIERLIELAGTGADRMERLWDISDGEVDALSKDAMDFVAFWKRLRTGESFPEMFVDIDAGLLREDHDARA